MFTNPGSFAAIINAKGNTNAFMKLKQRPSVASKFINNPKDGTIHRLSLYGVIKPHDKTHDNTTIWKPGPNYMYVYDYINNKK